MNFEIELGISTVNERCNEKQEFPDDVIVGAAKLTEQMIAGEEDVDFLFDSHIMALDLFRAGGVVGPLRSEAMIEASKIWLSRNQR